MALSIMLLTACDTEERPPEAVDEHLPPDIEAAREYFNEYASQEVEYELIGMHPGAIAADWTDVTTVVRDDMTVYNVGLFTEARYSGSFYIDPEVCEESYSTAIYQRLIVCRYPAGHYACFLASIIPAADCATMNREKISDMFICGDNGERGFSGFVIYSTVTTNYTVMFEQYRDGKGIHHLSVYEPYEDYGALLDEMRRLIGAKNISRQLVATSRSGGEFGSGITLPNVDVYGDGGGGSGGGSNPGGGVPTLPPPYQPPGPSYPGGNNTPPVFPPGYDRPGNGNIGNGGNNDNNSEIKPTEYKQKDSDKLVPVKKKIKYPKQSGETCVTTILRYVAQAYFKQNIGEDFFDKEYFNRYKLVTYFEGVIPALVRPLANSYFKTNEYPKSIPDAIDAGHTVMTNIIITGNTWHNILIIGYTSSGNYIYINPADAKAYVAPPKFFPKSYTFEIIKWYD